MESSTVSLYTEDALWAEYPYTSEVKVITEILACCGLAPHMETAPKAIKPRLTVTSLYANLIRDSGMHVK